MFLPGIGPLQLVLVLPKPSPKLVLDTFLAGIGPPKIMRKALDIRRSMIQITMNLRRTLRLAAKTPTPSPMSVLAPLLGSGQKLKNFGAFIKKQKLCAAEP